MLIVLTVVFGLYALLVLVLCWGWALLDDKAKTSTNDFRKISVVVAFRNEEVALPDLISSLKALNYPRQLAEFILVDDHSEDRSRAVVASLIAGDNRFTLLSADSNSIGKKSALTNAIARSSGVIIAVTDADCKVPTNWLTAINAAFADEKLKMVAGAVRFDATTWFGKMQAMEFASLIGTAGATIALGMPTMCNAANLAFRRNAFNEVDGFVGNEQVSSGDDQYLMKKFSTRSKNGVGFLYDSGAVVTAKASSTPNEFMNQRLRWAGKWTMATETTSILALGILFFHLFYIFTVVAWLIGSLDTTTFAALAGVRLFSEMIFLFPVCRFVNTRWLWSSFLFLQFFYPIYVVSIGFLSQILATRWKGREVTTRVWTGIS